MDLNDTPEQAAYRQQVRAWLDTAQLRGPRAQRRGRAHRPGRAPRGAARMAAPARRGRPRRRDVADRVRRPGPRPDRAGDRQPGDAQGARARHPRRDRRRHARPDDHRPRHRRAEDAATSARCCTATRSGASCSPSPPRARTSRRCRRAPRQGDDGSLDAQRAEGLDHERAVRGLRAAARADQPRAAEAQGHDDVHRADGRAGSHSPRPAPDLRRGGVQRGLLRRRRARRRRRRRARRRRLGRRPRRR